MQTTCNPTYKTTHSCIQVQKTELGIINIDLEISVEQKDDNDLTSWPWYGNDTYHYHGNDRWDGHTTYHYINIEW